MQLIILFEIKKKMSRSMAHSRVLVKTAVIELIG